MSVHETHAELERVRRDVGTARYELEAATRFNPDHVAVFRQRLEQALTRERALLKKLKG